MSFAVPSTVNYDIFVNVFVMNVGQVRAPPEVTLYISHLLPLYIRLHSQIYINSHVEIDCARSTL